MIFKIHQSNTCSVCQRALVVLMFMIVLTCKSYGQDDYTERDYGSLLTERNDPFPRTEIDTKIIPCRKLTKVDEVFLPPSDVHDISQIRIKPYEELTYEDKDFIATSAWQTGDTTLLSIIFKVIFTDTIVSSDPEISQEWGRKFCIKALSKFNTDAVKKILTSLLKDKEVGMVCAISLAKLGETEKAFQYIQSHYNEKVDYYIIQDIVTTLMKINTPDAIKLLMKISEHKDPSQALDALAALSLLGYCDFSYKGFCKYTTYEYWLVRRMVANCLIYYTGTPEAIRVVKSMYYKEVDSFAVGQLEEVLKKYNIFIIKR